MISAKKVLANRENAKKSTGPRTSSGKSRASRNALRHGLSRMEFVDEGYSERIRQIANKLCEHDPFPYRYHVALEVAEAQVLIDRIRFARAHVIATTKAHLPGPTRPPGLIAMSEDEFQALNIAIRKGHVRRVRQIIMAPTLRFKAFIDALARGEKAAPPPLYPVVPPKPLTEEQQRIENFCACLPRLASLERYERRALARKRRAIRKFDALHD